jgi:hypothetical protein
MGRILLTAGQQRLNAEVRSEILETIIVLREGALEDRNNGENCNQNNNEANNAILHTACHFLL